MGLLDWLVGRKSEDKRIAKLPGPGTFSIDIVGESKYQPALESICGWRSDESQEKIVEAALVHEDDNPYDDKAIRVDIQGKTVGYLSRENARQYRKKLEEAGYKGITATCFAKILGGWHRGSGDKGHFGVKLDLPTADQDHEDSEELPNVSEFRFSIVQPNGEQLAHAEIGDSVKFWSPADMPRNILIFRRGTVGGQGRLGSVPRKYARVIANHLAKGLPIESEILGVTASSCTIHCRLVQAEEANRAIEKKQEKLRAELMKPYRPKKPLEFSIDANSYVLNIEERLRLTQIPSIDNCIHDIQGAVLVFASIDGKKTIEKGDEPDIKKKIVRLAHTFGDLDFRVISKPNEKHWYKSEYKVQVTPVEN